MTNTSKKGLKMLEKIDTDNRAPKISPAHNAILNIHIS